MKIIKKIEVANSFCIKYCKYCKSVYFCIFHINSNLRLIFQLQFNKHTIIRRNLDDYMVFLYLIVISIIVFDSTFQNINILKYRCDIRFASSFLSYYEYAYNERGRVREEQASEQNRHVNGHRHNKPIIDIIRRTDLQIQYAECYGKKPLDLLN